MVINKRTIGQRLKSIRKKKDLTQEELSDICGISKPFIAKIEAGIQQPSTTVLFSLIDRCGVSIDWLLSGKGRMFIDDNRFISEIPDEYIEFLRNLSDLDENIRVALWDLFLRQLCLIKSRENVKKKE